MENSLRDKLDKLNNEMNNVTKELNETSILFVSKRKKLKERLKQLKFDIEVLNSTIKKERERLIRIGVDPDNPIPPFNLEKAKLQYASLRNMADNFKSSLTPDELYVVDKALSDGYDIKIIMEYIILSRGANNINKEIGNAKKCR